MRGFLEHIPIKQVLFTLAVLIYACFSSPTPDFVGPAEISVFVLLFLSLQPDFSASNGYALILACYGLSVPLIISLVSGYAPSEIIRDVIPFIFLLMPILFYYRDEKDTQFLGRLVSIAGIIFSLRSLQSFSADISNPMQWLGTPPDLLYLSNSPEVLFAAIYFLYNALRPQEKILHRIFYILLASIPLLAMATLMQRASLFYILLCVMIFIGILMFRKPRSASIIILIVFPFISLLPFIDDIFQQLSVKTQMVGLNSRGQEWRAVMKEISSSAISYVFGKGWGAELENPAVGGLRVSFTHSLVSSLWFKTGLIGVFLSGLYFFNLAKAAAPFLIRNQNYFFALAGPLLIGFVLYASYKSLGYGLLILILASCAKGKRLEEPVSSVP